MKTRTLRLSALFTAAALTATGCTSVADMMGYDTATLNARAAKADSMGGMPETTNPGTEEIRITVNGTIQM